MKPSEILSAAADLIEPEGAWTQGANARLRNALGQPTGASDPKAACWCAFGAMLRKTSAPSLNPFYAATGYAEKVIDGVNLRCWNDEKGRTQAEVVSALRKAAELARSEGQ